MRLLFNREPAAFIKYSYLVLLMLTMLSCVESGNNNIKFEERYLQEYYQSDNIDSLFQTADIIVSVELDSLSADNVVTRKDIRRLYIDSLENAPTNFFSYPIRGLDFLDINTLVVSSSKDEVRVLDLSTSSTVKVFSGGKGPSEFLSPQDLVADGKHIAISDYGNLRVQLFDKDYNYIRTAPVKSLHPSNTIGLSNDNLLMIDNISSINPILNSVNIKTGATSSTEIPTFFQGDSYAAYNMLIVRSDDNYIGICSVGAPYILIYDTNLELKYFIQFKNSKIEMLFDRLKATLSNSHRGNEISSIKLILDFAIKDGVLFVNTFESGRIISIKLDQIKSPNEFEWKVYSAGRPNRADSSSGNVAVQPSTMRFAVLGNSIVAYDTNKDNEFFDIIQY